MNLEEIMVTAIINNTPLVIGIAVAGWWLFPKLLRNSLLNGSGEVIRNIVREEGIRTQDEHDERVERLIHKALQEHQLRTDMDLQALKYQVKQDLIEASGEWKLSKK